MVNAKTEIKKKGGAPNSAKKKGDRRGQRAVRRTAHACVRARVHACACNPGSGQGVQEDKLSRKRDRGHISCLSAMATKVPLYISAG